MASNRWVQIGRELVEQSISLRKSERLALVRKRAKELDLSSHTVGRFLVLADFLARFELTLDEEERLPIGVIEVVYRLDSKNRSMAEAMLKELIEHGITFREALRREAALAQSQASPEQHAVKKSDPALADKIRRAINERGVEFLKYVSDRSRDRRVAAITSLWDMGGVPVAFISERDPIYLYKRGFKNFIRDIVVAKFENELVVIEFTSREMLDHYLEYIEPASDGFKEDVKYYLDLQSNDE